MNQTLTFIATLSVVVALLVLLGVTDPGRQDRPSLPGGGVPAWRNDHVLWSLIRLR